MNGKRKIFCGALLIVAFALWTVLVRIVDVEASGPHGSLVGFATLNTLVHNALGVHMWLYTVTDWLGLVPIAVALGFAILGLCQWIKRKHISRVDRDILALGAFYIIVICVYVIFEYVVINYRPVLINGALEVSYPSSTTMLVMCVMPTAVMQMRARIKNKTVRAFVCAVLVLFTLFMVIGRLVSGVHWLSDIIGGVLVSAGLCLSYKGACRLL